jgi:hypothetical protein
MTPLTWDKIRTAVNPNAAPVEYSDDAIALEFSDRHDDDLRYTAVWGRWSGTAFRISSNDCGRREFGAVRFGAMPQPSISGDAVSPDAELRRRALRHRGITRSRSK